MLQANDVRDIVRRASQGDHDAWKALVEEYSSLLWGVARGFRLDEARTADAVQTTWLRLFEHLGDIRQPESLPGWLCTTIRRTCLAALRESKREEPVETLPEHAAWGYTRQWGPDSGCPERTVLRREHQRIVRGVLAQLPPQHRSLIEMLHSSPAPSYKEVSARLGMPVGSIGPTRARILDRMHEMLATSDLRDGALV